MKSIVCVKGKGKGRRGSAAPAAPAAEGGLAALDSRVELIQALIPLGLQAVNQLLQQEVAALAGPRYQRRGGVPGYDRWGSQSGSVYLADQKVAVTVPRVRYVRHNQEVPLSTYQALRQPRRAEEAALRKILKGLSCRNYEACVEPVAETFGLKASSLSRRFKRASARKLAELPERDLSSYDLVGLFRELGRSFKTANWIENLNALIAQRTDKVDCWRNADQKHRWLATSLLDIEPRLRKVCGYQALAPLRAALRAELNGTVEKVA